MCLASFVGDNYLDRFEPVPWPNPIQSPGSIFPPVIPGVPSDYLKWAKENDLPDPNKTIPIEYATKQQFEDLKKEILEMKEFLKKAIKYDEEHNEPHCENEEKYAVLRNIAELVGVSLDDVIGGVNVPVTPAFK